MKVLLISTVRHNPGDAFIRFGQEWLLRKVVPEAVFTVVHKHDPRTLFGDFQRRARTPHRLSAPWLYRFHRRMTSGRDLLAEADVVVFAGTPFIWRQNTRILPSTSANAEWVGATWNRLFTEFRHKPVLNIAAGASLNDDQDRAAVLEDDRLKAFLTRAVERASLTTARDRLTADIFAELGYDVPVLPCTSLWAARGAGLEASAPGYVAVNVMRQAVHPARGKSTVTREWRRVIESVVSHLSERFDIRFVCHSPDERDTVRAWFPGHRWVYDADPLVVLNGYAGAIMTLSNRVHGAGGAASFCRPALGVGGDSRMTLLREFGLPTLTASSVTAEGIIDLCAKIHVDRNAIGAHLSDLARKAEMEYTRLLSTAL